MGQQDAPGAGAQALFEMMIGFINACAVMAAAELGLPDRLAGGPRTAGEVADEIGAQEPAVGRLLRDLTGTGVIISTGHGRFALGPLGEYLRSDVPGSQRAFYRMVSGAAGQGMLGGHASVWKGTPAFETMFGMPFFDYMGQNPEYATVFNQAMVDYGAGVTNPAIAAYDFSGVRTVVDVGGGHGQLVCEVLRSHPGTQGVVVDLPHVVQETLVEIERAGLTGRCQAVAGDFFKSVPAGDCYTLRWIVHDWDDERSVTILTRCREAIDPAGRLLLFELVMPEGDEPHMAKAYDYAMMSLLSGRERTEAEYAALLQRAGFRLNRVVTSPSPMSIVEALPA